VKLDGRGEVEDEGQCPVSHRPLELIQACGLGGMIGQGGFEGRHDRLENGPQKRHRGEALQNSAEFADKGGDDRAKDRAESLGIQSPGE